VLDASKLREARQHPEKFRDLVISLLDLLFLRATATAGNLHLAEVRVQVVACGV